MRLKRNRLKRYYHRQAVPKKDTEGGSYTDYADPVPFLAEMWPGGGKLQAEMYGIRLPNIRNLRIDGNYAEKHTVSGAVSYVVEDGPCITVGDGVCLYTAAGDDPDYRVVGIYPYSHLTLEVEKI